jgi:hypothetical protein
MARLGCLISLVSTLPDEQKDGRDEWGMLWFWANVCVCVPATNSKGETEGFWGVDHMGQLADFLGLERPAGKGWKALL